MNTARSQILTEAQLATLEKAKIDKEARGEFEYELSWLQSSAEASDYWKKVESIAA